MAYNNFKPTVWGKHIQTELENFLVMKDDCNFQYDGDAKEGCKVKILGVARPTIGDYDGTDIGTPEEVADTSMFLDIDQAKYFNFRVDDVDLAQSIEGLMPALMQESAVALATEADKYIGAQAVDAGKKSASLKIATAADAKKAVDDAFGYLWEKGVTISDSVSLTVTPWFYNIFKDKLTELSTDNLDLIRQGIIGTYNGAVVKMSNNLYNDATDDYLMLRSDKAIAFAGQIDKTEAYRPHGLFADAVKGLYTYGAKVVRPDEIYVIKAHK